MSVVTEATIEAVTKPIKEMEITDETNNSNSNATNSNTNNNNEEKEVLFLTPDDPNYSENKTVLGDPENVTIKHPLQNSWSLWFDNPGKKTSQSTWGDQLRKVVAFDTVCGHSKSDSQC